MGFLILVRLHLYIESGPKITNIIFRTIDLQVQFKCTSEKVVFKNRKLDTKIILLDSMIPKFKLFYILRVFAILVGGDIEFLVMWC